MFIKPPPFEACDPKSINEDRIKKQEDKRKQEILNKMKEAHRIAIEYVKSLKNS